MDLRTVGTSIADSMAYQAALTDALARITVLEAFHAHAGAHTRYFGWSDDRIIETVDLTGAAESEANSGIIPARNTNGYLFFGVPENIGYPSMIRIDNGPDQFAAFEQLTDAVDDDLGVAHLIGITTREQAFAIAGDVIELGY